MAEAIDSGELSVAGCTTLELGAGAGLPSLSAALGGADAVVCTDYGTEADDSLVAALRANAAALAAARDAATAAGAAAWCDVQVAPHVWGTDCAPLLALLPPAKQAAAAASDAAAPRRFDRIFLADLLFNRQSHRQLLATCAVRATPRVQSQRASRHMRLSVVRMCLQACLAPGGTVWVAYSHHDPGKAALDNAFFPLAQAAPYGFAVRKARARSLCCASQRACACVRPPALIFCAGHALLRCLIRACELFDVRCICDASFAGRSRRFGRCVLSGTCLWRAMGWTRRARSSTSTS
jgi:hypothetical protein